MTTLIEPTPFISTGRQVTRWPYTGWEIALGTIAVVATAAFAFTEDRPGLWKVLTIQCGLALLLAVALDISVRASVPNLAVAGISTAASVIAAKVVGEDGSAAAIIGIAAVVGAFVGVGLALLVVLLRAPAWAATLGAAIALFAVSLRVTGDGSTRNRILRVRPIATDAWGWPVLIVAAGLAIAVGLVSWLPGSQRMLDALRSAGIGRERVAPTTWLVQSGALIASSVVAAVAGAVLLLRVGGALAASADLFRPLSIVLLAGISLRGRAGGITTLVSAALLLAVADFWTQLRGWDFSWTVTISAAAAIIGLIVGSVLELVARSRRPAPDSYSPPPGPLIQPTSWVPPTH
jgi:predicted ABC-type sugar transport system permease subunit